MIALTTHLGQPVVQADGRQVGRVVDLCAPHRAGAVVDRLVVGGRRRTKAIFAWDSVASFDRDRVHLHPGALPQAPSTARDEIWLMRDVVDAQILDTEGRRVLRAADVDLVRRGRHLEVAGVDVGAGALLRRLGLSRVARRHQRRMIPWRRIEVAHGQGLRLRPEHVPRRFPHRRHRRHAPR